MTKLRIFTVQAEAEGRWTRNRDPEQHVVADLEDELSRFRYLQAPVSHVSVVASMGVMESPSRYLEPLGARCPIASAA